MCACLDSGCARRRLTNAARQPRVNENDVRLDRRRNTQTTVLANRHSYNHAFLA
jgi:hypothetical protein